MARKTSQARASFSLGPKMKIHAICPATLTNIAITLAEVFGGVCTYSERKVIRLVHNEVRGYGCRDRLDRLTVTQVRPAGAKHLECHERVGSNLCVLLSSEFEAFVHAPLAPNPHMLTADSRRRRL